MCWLMIMLMWFCVVIVVVVAADDGNEATNSRKDSSIIYKFKETATEDTAASLSCSLSLPSCDMCFVMRMLCQLSRVSNGSRRLMASAGITDAP